MYVYFNSQMPLNGRKRKIFSQDRNDETSRLGTLFYSSAMHGSGEGQGADDETFFSQMVSVSLDVLCATS